MRHMGHGSCCSPPCCFPMVGPYYYWYPVPFVPASQAATMVREIEVDADTSSREALMGGISDARPTLEYLVEEGADGPSVAVTISAPGHTINWTASDTTAGYHVYDQFGAAEPGTRVTLEASGALARLRWCEAVCC